MGNIKTTMALMLCSVIVVCCAGCHSYAYERKTTVEFVKVHEAELLELYAMYEALEKSGSDDYSEIHAYKEAHFYEDPVPDIRYYGDIEKMEIWFDLNHDGRDWGIVYRANPDFDLTSLAHTEVYDEIKDGFYTYIYYHGF